MYLFLLVLTLLLCAFFTASETAYVSSNRLKIYLQSRRDPKNKMLRLLTDAQKVLIITLVGTNVVMVACSSLAVLIFSPHLEESVLVFLTTAVLLIFGEILPKSIARQMPNRMSRAISRPLNLSYFLLYPLIKIAEIVSQNLVEMFGGGSGDLIAFFKKQDLEILLREYSSAESVSERDRILVNRALRITDKRVNDVMIPRMDIVGLDVGIDIQEVKKAFISTGFSRLPIYDDDIDHIVGFIYALEMFSGNVSLKDMMRPAYYVPETTKAIDALQQLQGAEISIAIAIDEHGGTAGLVTLEDIVEELFGDITDEYDSDSSYFRRLNKRTFLVSGRAEIDDLHERLQLFLPRGEYVTIAGLIESRLGRIPQPGDQVKLEGCRLIVTKADRTKIIEVKIIRKKIPPDSPDQSTPTPRVLS